MNQPSPDKSAQLISAYLASKKVLIADASSASRAGLARTLVNMGAKTVNIITAPTCSAAQEEIGKHHPSMVLADFDLGPDCGLNLLQTQRDLNPDSKKSIFVLVTGNTSQSAVAQAAEEDVDTFVLKPYTLEVLRQSIMKAIVAKVSPSPYLVTIDSGKKLLFESKVDEAMELFKRALEMDPKPALAHFYIGQVNLMKEALELAESNFDAGLRENKIHYKCLVGLYDLLMKKKAYREAYDVVKRLSRYFPANPKRLTEVLRLAVMTQSYEDIERYYQSYTSIENRSEELIKYVCAALVVCGKFYLKRNFGSRAIDLFNKASVAAAGRIRILREVVMALFDEGLHKEAQDFLRRFPAHTMETSDYLTAAYLVGSATLSDQELVEKGRAILKKGFHEPLVYRILIRSSSRAGLKDYTETLLQDASQRWPDQQAIFEKLARTPPTPTAPAAPATAPKKSSSV